MSTSRQSAPSEQTRFKRFVRGALSYQLTYWLCGAMILLLDTLTGPLLMFPILFVIPVALAAWFYSGRLGVILAVVLPFARALITIFLEQPTPLLRYTIANSIIRVVVLVLIAYLAHRAKRTRELERKVVQLEGILPICSFCKRIRDEDQNWQQLESYISAHSEADFSHGICAECGQEHYGDILAKNRDA